jgi:ribosome-associated protein
MDNFQLKGRDYIELNKLLKLLNWVGTGGEANVVIDAGEVTVNGVIETRRRNKLREGFVVEYQSYKVLIEDNSGEEKN